MSYFKAYEFPFYVKSSVAYSTKYCYIKFKYIKRRSSTHLDCFVIVRSTQVTENQFINVSSVELYTATQLYVMLPFKSEPYPIEVGVDEIIPVVSHELDVAVDPYHAYLVVVEGPPSSYLDIYFGNTKLATISPRDLDQDGKGLTSVVFVPSFSMILSFKPNNCNWSLFRMTYIDFLGARRSPVLTCRELIFTGTAYTEVETMQTSASALSLAPVPSPKGTVYLESWEVGWSGSGTSSGGVAV